MKKLLSLVVAAGFLVGSAAMASATDIKVKGKFDFGFGLYDGTHRFQHEPSEEHFDALQRFRTQVDFIASESLKGVAQFEIGTVAWGHEGEGRGSGGSIGTDGVNVETKHLYIDWLVPQTDLQVRMGLQPFALPQAVRRADGEDGGFIVDDDMAGVLLSYDFNENVGINFGWFRPWDTKLNNDDLRGTDSRLYDDEIDAFALTLPIEFKNNFSFTPYGMYALIGQNVDGAGLQNNLSAIPDHDLLGAGRMADNGKAWWAGFAFDLSRFDPFVAAVDFAYGRYTADSYTLAGERVDPDRDGWTVIAKLGYKLDYFTPILFGWYGSGTSDLDQDGLDGLMPTLSPDWGLTSFGWSNAHPLGREYVVGATPTGTWAIGVGLEDIKFIDRLTSQLRVLYFRGTNDYNGIDEILVRDGGTHPFSELNLIGKKDQGFEVNLDNVINIYENFDMFVELGYVHFDLKHEPENFEDNAFKSYVGFTYNF